MTTNLETKPKEPKELTLEERLQNIESKFEAAKILLQHGIEKALKACKEAQEAITEAKTANEKSKEAFHKHCEEIEKMNGF